jgi:hypothetical protein
MGYRAAKGTIRQGLAAAEDHAEIGTCLFKPIRVENRTVREGQPCPTIWMVAKRKETCRE